LYNDSGFENIIDCKKGASMTKAELVEKIAEEVDISKAESLSVINSFIDNVTEALKEKDGGLRLSGFGTFSRVHRKARKGRNPQTGDTIKIKAHDVVKFKPSKKLNAAI
jgi:DNA-binding protein HU-beta